jgi:glycerate dehydrogenase
MKNIVFLDSKTFGKDVDLSNLSHLGHLTLFPVTEKSDIVPRCFGAEIIITNKVKLNKEILKSLPSLRLICVAATGMDHVDLKCADELGIKVLNVAGYSTNSVVQHTFAMLFYLLMDLKYYDEYTSTNQWEKSDIFTHFKSFSELSGKKWGIIGLGSIGEKVASIANLFGAEVSYYSTSGKNKNENFNKVTLDQLLTESDIISIHAPLNEKTKNLIQFDELKKISDHTILLNVGRGGIINEQSLETFLLQSDLRIGLDVTESEPIVKESALSKIAHKKNLLITPHIAWASKEARQRLVDQICLNIKTHFN